MVQPLRFGAFAIPLHDPIEDPQLSLWRDMQEVELLDRLGYNEFWLGEHHSQGWATIVAPDLVIASLAERTRQITLATGVTSLPYHHPFMVATRAVQLDHLTRGRFILGVGAGSIASDGLMLGIEQATVRDRTAEALEVILHLLNSEEPLTVKSDWFTLQEARLQLGPYSPAGIELGIASMMTPSSMRLAGRHGISALSFGAPRPGLPGVDLRRQWEYTEEAAAQSGKAANRANWRITLTVHVAETRREAFANVRKGFDRWVHGFWEDICGLDVNVEGIPRSQELEYWVESGNGLVGSPEDVIDAIEQLQERTGGFGTLLLMTHDWASWEKTKTSYELFARYVMPHFTGALSRRQLAAAWYRDNQKRFVNSQIAAIQHAMNS